MSLPKNGCAGCGDKSWDNGQCGTCKRCFNCCNKYSVPRSCANRNAEKESKLTPEGRARRRLAQARYLTFGQRINLDFGRK